jgi:hypothetical protein
MVLVTDQHDNKHVMTEDSWLQTVEGVPASSDE